MTYQLIDHTADFGIRVFGPNAGSLYEAAARAMFDQICNPADLTCTDCLTLSVTGVDWPDLMVNWLRELLFLWAGEGFLVKDVAVERISQNRLKAQVTADRFDAGRHRILNEIKAVTYHQIQVQERPSGWEATVIFDV
jgi:SHS2 domain-containing protein